MTFRAKDRNFYRVVEARCTENARCILVMGLKERVGRGPGFGRGKIWCLIRPLCVALPLLGIAAEVAKWAGAPRHAASNIAAWNALVVASAYYAVIARIWWHHGFPGRLASKPSGRPASPRE